MLTNKEIGVLCYCRGCLNRKCALSQNSDRAHYPRYSIIRGES